MALMQTTNQYIQKEHLTALMITHQLEDALKYGNRILVLNQGQIQVDMTENARKQLTAEKLYDYLVAK